MVQAAGVTAGARAAGTLVAPSFSSQQQHRSSFSPLTFPLWRIPGLIPRSLPKHSSTIFEHDLRAPTTAVRATHSSEGRDSSEREGDAGSNPLERLDSEATVSDAQRRLDLKNLDKIEVAAKASIDKLRHIIYKLRTQAPAPRSTTISSSSSGDELVATGSASAKLKGKQEQLFIKQDFEIELGSFGASLTSERGGADADPTEADAFVHHDALTCTQTAVRIDEKTGTAVVTVTATVRGAEIADQGSYTERSVALATRALARTCLALDEKAQAALAGGETVLKALPKLDTKPHELLLEVLQDGKITKFSPAVQMGASPFRQSYEVELEIPQWSQSKAIFKPFVPGDAYLRWQRAPSEWVAYQLNLLLGLDVVPPAAIRTGVQIGNAKHELGVMVWAVEGLRPLPSLSTREWGVPAPLSLIASAHVLDALLGNAPRKPHEFKAGTHWSLKGGLKPVLWEHPMGPSGGALHSMWSRRGELKGVKSISATTMARLKALSHNALFEQLAGALTSDEMQLILERRDQVVAYFEAMAKRYGEDIVLV